MLLIQFFVFFHPAHISSWTFFCICVSILFVFVFARICIEFHLDCLPSRLFWRLFLIFDASVRGGGWTGREPWELWVLCYTPISSLSSSLSLSFSSSLSSPWELWVFVTQRYLLYRHLYHRLHHLQHHHTSQNLSINPFALCINNQHSFREGFQ